MLSIVVQALQDQPAKELPFRILPALPSYAKAGWIMRSMPDASKAGISRLAFMASSLLARHLAKADGKPVQAVDGNARQRQIHSEPRQNLFIGFGAIEPLDIDASLDRIAQIFSGMMQT